MGDRRLFRGKRLDNGEWVTGSYLADFGGDSWILATETIPKTKEDAETVWGKVRASTVGQCTGIKDEKNRLIFDGDIVFIQDWDCYAEVLWACGAWELYFGPASSTTEYLYDMADRCSVAGNIHDTKELTLGELEKNENRAN